MRRAGRVARGLALACHPGPAAVVTVLAAALAVGLGSAPRTTVLVTAAVLAGQLSVGWSNDWIDAARDVAVGRSDKPVVTGLLDAATLRRWALGAAAVCVPLSLATGVLPGAVHLVAVASAWAYNATLKRTAWSWAPYAVSFGLLLVFVALADPGRGLPTAWGVLAASLLGVGAHVANVLPDLEDDAATGVRGLPHRLGRVRATVVALGSLLAATAVIVLAPPEGPRPVTWAGAALALVLAAVGGGVALVRRRSRLPFTMSMAVAVVCVALLVLAGPELVAGSGTGAGDAGGDGQGVAVHVRE
jgi:4-hydroxybenzoate polyprenyltransferase